MSAVSLRLVHTRDLLRELVARDMKIRYKRSILGIAWSLVNPITQILIFTFLFNRVLPLNIPNYTSFVFAGVLAWSWFSSALIAASGAIVDNRELVRRPGFAVAVLPIVTVMTNALHFVLALPVLFIVLFIGGGQFGLPILALPLIMLVQFVLTLGISYVIAASHVRFRDTQHIVGIGLMLMFYLTPVFYRAESVPEQYILIYQLNPMAGLLSAYRAALIEGQWPAPGPLLQVLVIGGLLLAVGLGIFRRASDRFVEEL